MLSGVHCLRIMLCTRLTCCFVLALCSRCAPGVRRYGEADDVLQQGAQLRCVGNVPLLADVFSGQCCMIEGEEPLVCSCGLNSATYVPARKKQKARWMVLSARVGQKPQPITNLNTKSKALERVKALCAAAAVVPSVQPTPATTASSNTSQPRLRQHPAEKVWEGEPGHSWMGRIDAGDKYILARKLIKGATELMYATSEREYYLNIEDLRVINMKHREVDLRRSARRVARNGVNDKKTYAFVESEIEKLKIGCWDPSRQVVNL